MKRWITLIPILMFLMPAAASADTWVLWDWDAYQGGATFNPPGVLPGSINASAFDFSTGLGTIVFSFSGAGAHSAGIYLYPFFGSVAGGDNSTAYGTVVGSATAGLSYQMAWPGLGSPTIWDNFAGAALNNSNTVPAYAPPPAACCSVAMAEIQFITLLYYQQATVTFNVASSAPTSGFYLEVTDHDSGNSIYLAEDLVITGSPPSGVPEPGSFVLVASGLGWVWAVRRRRSH